MSPTPFLNPANPKHKIRLPICAKHVPRGCSKPWGPFTIRRPHVSSSRLSRTFVHFVLSSCTSITLPTFKTHCIVFANNKSHPHLQFRSSILLPTYLSYFLFRRLFELLTLPLYLAQSLSALAAESVALTLQPPSTNPRSIHDRAHNLPTYLPTYVHNIHQPFLRLLSCLLPTACLPACLLYCLLACIPTYLRIRPFFISSDRLTSFSRPPSS
ncbi:uncharacterized protein F4822DRAFT_30480 [Hypoxylon trugodes]|uniref:uncharacterized protein n=1 Tax=Hypoxylon trugodes TaxID=326681 RepID=UPI00219AA18D|nr:uncharacterized protein F4822DRAFT_30480 [Hypoxylon trugodes]KAI1393929.1 hypothetical protein F4822DRAFT_30480 [Hypoxylon trugodes]